MPFRITLPLVLLVGFVAVGLLAGRTTATGSPDLIKIVSSLPRSGSARGQTDTIVNGIRLAFEDVKYQVTTGGKTFRIDYQDLDDATAAAGQWTIEQEIANANQARSDPDVMAYIGTYNSGAAKVSMPILNRADLLMISPANTAPALTKPGWGERHEPVCYQPAGRVNYTRVVPTDDVQGAVAAQWAKDLGLSRVYILDDNEVYGQGIAKVFRATCGTLGVTVLNQESIDFKAQEFTALMTKIKGQTPDLIYFGGTTQTKAGQLFKDMIKVGLTCPMMAPDGCYEKAMIDSAGKEAFERAKFYVTFGGVPPEQLVGAGKEFVAKYAAKFGSPPKEAYAAYGYDCGIVALAAIRKAGGKDRNAVREAALAIADGELDGTTGSIRFDKNGDTFLTTMSGNVVADGEFKFLTLLKLK